MVDIPRDLIDQARQANALVAAKRWEFEQACHDRAALLRSIRDRGVNMSRLARELGISRARLYELVGHVDSHVDPAESQRDLAVRGNGSAQDD